LYYTSFRKQPIGTNHYLGSWERYNARNDKRRSRSVYDLKATVRRGKDDFTGMWLKGFVNTVGYNRYLMMPPPSLSEELYESDKTTATTTSHNDIMMTNNVHAMTQTDDEEEEDNEELEKNDSQVDRNRQDDVDTQQSMVLNVDSNVNTLESLVGDNEEVERDEKKSMSTTELKDEKLEQVQNDKVEDDEQQEEDSEEAVEGFNEEEREHRGEHQGLDVQEVALDQPDKQQDLAMSQHIQGGEQEDSLEIIKIQSNTEYAEIE
jgi:hypothetical protein